MASKMDRQVDRFTVNITDSLSTTAPFVMEDHALLTLYFPAGWTNDTLTVYAKSPADGNFYALKTSDNTAVTMTANTSCAAEVPDNIFACDVVKFVCTVAGNNAVTVGGVAKS